jgi:hypothetical protein
MTILEEGLLPCDVVSSGRNLRMFRRNFRPVFSESKNATIIITAVRISSPI